MSVEQLFQRAEAAVARGAFSRISDDERANLFVGIDEGRWALMAVCQAPPGEAPSMASLSVDARPRRDGAWALVIRLEAPELKGLFVRFAEDLDHAIRHALGDPGRVVIERLVRWQRLFARAQSRTLDDAALRGLLAELEFLLSESVPAYGAAMACAAWRGPFEAPRDFSFPDREVEVKATGRTPRTVRISSTQQLTDGGLPLYLRCKVVELADASTGAGISISQFVSSVRAAVGESVLACDRLELALVAAGYEDRPEYGERAVLFGSTTIYRVREGFPRIQDSEVAPGIVACSYDIEWIALAPFVVQTWQE